MSKLVDRPVIVCLCNKKNSVEFDLLHLQFDLNKVTVFTSFSYQGFYKSVHTINYLLDLLIEDGPSVCATVGMITHSTQNTSPSSDYNFQKAIILYSFHFPLTCREEGATITIDQEKVHLSLPKENFPDATVLYCLQVEEGYVVISTTTSILTLTLYSNHILTTLLQFQDELQSIRSVPCLPHTYTLQFEKECVVLQRFLHVFLLNKCLHRYSWQSCLFG